jgi:putative transposase
MPRTPRVVPDGFPFHVINRGNRRATIFHNPTDFEAFLEMMADASEKIRMRILAWALMKNHFHLVLWPYQGAEISAYMAALSNAHVHHYQAVNNLVGTGHVYQGRFKSFIIKNDVHLINVARYVEANPIRAGCVRRAEEWRWSSAGSRYTASGRLLASEWPFLKPHDWLEVVNAAIPPADLVALRQSVRRGTPYGDEAWRSQMVRTYGLHHTVRPRGHQPQSVATVRVA